MTTADNTPQHLQTVRQNITAPDDCITVEFREMEFLPWDNPDNIISAEVEAIVRRIKNTLLVFLFLIGGPANVINMAVFYKQGIKDRVNLCLFSLSFADGLYLVMSLLLNGEQAYLQFTTGQPFGPITVFLANTNLMALIGIYFVSPVLSTILAIERCLCVFNPLKFQSLLRARTMAAIIIAATILSIGIFFVVSFRYRFHCVFDPITNTAVTTAVEGEFYRAHKEFIDHLDSFLFGVGLPSVEMIVVTTTTIMTIVKLRQVVTWRSESSSTISREVALTKMLVGNSILFIACLSPIALNRFSWLFFPEVNSGQRNHNFFFCGLWVSDIFTYINATFNIFVYYAMGSRYRETFWAMFGKKTKLGQQSKM